MSFLFVTSTCMYIQYKSPHWSDEIFFFVNRVRVVILPPNARTCSRDPTNERLEEFCPDNCVCTLHPTVYMYLHALSACARPDDPPLFVARAVSWVRGNVIYMPRYSRSGRWRAEVQLGSFGVRS